MSSGELDLLRAEFRQRRIGPALYALLGRIVAGVAPVYPPAIYAPSGTWDQASITDLLHDWIGTRLLRGDLEAMLASAASMQSLRAQLAASLRQLVINGRQRDSAINLYLRTVDLLRDDEAFRTVGEGTPAHRQWTVAADPRSEPSTMTLNALIAVAYVLSDMELKVIRYGAHSLKSSPILRAGELKRFVEHLLAGAQGTLDATRIAEVQQHRFSLLRQPAAQLAVELDSGQPPVELQVLAADAAEAVLRGLRVEDIEAIRALEQAGWVVSRAAEMLDCSQGRISAARDRVAAAAAAHASSEEEAVATLKIVLESLFQ